MEFFVSLLILIFVKMLEWTFALIKWTFKGIWLLFAWPFKLKQAGSKAAPKAKASASKRYSGPIDKAIDHWENDPKELDMEDMFWLDELLGDD